MTLTTVAPHIYQVTLPLPFALNHVHCYLLDDGDGWTAVDAGLHTSQTEAGWLAAFTELGITPAHLKRIILTHTHPDHYGAAGWLEQWSDGRAAVHLSPREAEVASRTWGEWGQHEQLMVRHLLRAGLTPAMAQEVAENTQFVATRTRPHPTHHELLQPRSRIEMAQRTFDILSYAGHSDGQLLFHCSAEALMLSGDHVLMDITPNISLWPGGWVNPLGRYLDSLRELKGVEVALALPGHKRLIHDWHGRLAELEKHHAERLGHTLAAVQGGDSTTAEIAKTVFRLNHLTVHEARFAITETLAHLEYLAHQGAIKEDEAGKWGY
ncbi:MAG: MBL fold metallo-hydrolase [Chloroflexi bacterium]|nr:MBL fold metallo-hydrolase [Chloroflexota bacterium]